MSLYSELIAANVPVSNWQSDLYFKNTPEAKEILKNFPDTKVYLFRSNTDGEIWGEVPFSYDPYWKTVSI